VEVITSACNDDVVYLPTGFTPNNDGANDILYIRSNFITEVYLTIYDRWGEKLFETNDVKKGWDGTYKGKLLDQGVYGYYMTFTCNNGEQSFKKGNITLMR
jgi:gliding motility-associated-like protein